jgi:hypothetical protein
VPVFGKRIQIYLLFFAALATQQSLMRKDLLHVHFVRRRRTVTKRS